MLYDGTKKPGPWERRARAAAALDRTESANAAAGTAALNRPYFRLYRTHADALRSYTDAHAGYPDTEGLFVPEITRFDGSPIRGDIWHGHLDTPWRFVALVLSTTGEVAYNVWQQYQYTRDEAFLRDHYPILRDAVRFFLTYAREDESGELYVAPSNALETQTDTKNPAPDVAAMTVLFPIVADLAPEFGDEALAEEVLAAIPKLPSLPLTDDGTLATAAEHDPSHKGQHPQLEAVWPWGLLGHGDGSEADRARETFREMTLPNEYGWALEAVQAARLGLAAEVEDLLVGPTDAEHVRFDVERGAAYVLERVASPASSFEFEPVGGEASDRVRRLGERAIGVPAED